MTALSAHPTYTPAQLTQYFTHISLPPSLHPTPTTLHHHPPTALAFLTQLQRRQIATVPFENLRLHYSQSHALSLDPESLFGKIVQRGHGGYCMENNCFFGTVVRSLGYRVWGVGARVNRGVGGMGEEGWEGWSHMVNVVVLASGQRYMVDVGFGDNGPIEPMLLDAEAGHRRHIKPGETRLVHEGLPESMDMSQKFWQYQHRVDPGAEWQTKYCFTELEFLPDDYKIMSFWTSQSPKSWFTYRVVAVKMFLEGEDVVGTLILSGSDVKRRIGGKTEHLRSCKTEEERVRALEEVFGLRLTDEERRGIRGMVTELKD